MIVFGVGADFADTGHLQFIHEYVVMQIPMKRAMNDLRWNSAATGPRISTGSNQNEGGIKRRNALVRLRSPIHRQQSHRDIIAAK